MLTRFLLGTLLLQVSQGGSSGSSFVSRAVQNGDKIFLKVSETGNFVTAQEDGEVHTRWDHRGDWQKFTVEKADGDGEVMSGDAVFLTAWTGKRITVEGVGVHALWDHMGSWERLVIEGESGQDQIMPGSSISLRGHLGARIDGGSTDKPGEVHARYDHQGSWQRFIIEVAEPVEKPATTAPQTSTSLDPDVLALNTVSLKAWEHFQLIQSLRLRGFACPNGTIYPENPSPLQFDCRLWKAASALKMTKTTASAPPSFSFEETQGIMPEAGNVASGDETPLQALRKFEASDKDCANMLSAEYKLVGVAHADDGMEQYWTQLFSKGDGTELVDVSCYPPEVAYVSLGLE